MTVRGIGDVEALANRLRDGLGLLSGDLERQVESSTKAIAKKGARILRKTSPERTERYAKGWTSSKVKGSWVIHNKDRYQLTHLLENGHPSRLTGVPVPPQEHIAPVESQLITEYISELERIITND